VSASIWGQLGAKGIDRAKVEPALAKILGPPTTIAKPQFREVFLKEVSQAVGRPMTHEETIEYFLVADEIWDTWPKVS
jgi:hypothetical protein